MAPKGKKQGTRKARSKRPVTSEKPAGMAKPRADGFELVRTGSDGNCLFRAVAVQLYGTEERHSDVRTAAVKHLMANESRYSVYVAEQDVRRTNKRRGVRGMAALDDGLHDRAALFRKRVESMSRAGEFGTELELAAIADVYRVGVWVYSSALSDVTKYGADYQVDGRLRVNLHYSSVAQHYSSLRRVGSEWPASGAFEDAESASPVEAAAKDTDNVSQRSISSKRSFSGRDEQDIEDSSPRKKQQKDVNRPTVVAPAVPESVASRPTPSPEAESRPSTARTTPPSSVERELSDINSRAPTKLAESRQARVRKESLRAASKKQKAEKTKKAEAEAEAKKAHKDRMMSVGGWVRSSRGHKWVEPA